MAMNKIQFQPGLSMPEFLKHYGTEAQCEHTLEAVRWPEGFRSGPEHEKSLTVSGL